MNKSKKRYVAVINSIVCFLMVTTPTQVKAWDKYECHQYYEMGWRDGWTTKMTNSVLLDPDYQSCYEEGFWKAMEVNTNPQCFGLNCRVPPAPPMGEPYRKSSSQSNPDRFEHCYDPNNSENIFGAISCILEQGQ